MFLGSIRKLILLIAIQVPFYALWAEGPGSNELSATVIAVRGRAQYRPAGEGEWSTIVRETLIREDDSLRTGLDTYLELDMGGSARVSVLKPSVLRLKVFRRTATNLAIGLRITDGRFRILVDPSKAPFFVAETKDGRVATAGGDFLLDAAVDKTSVHTLAGLVNFNNTFQTGEPVLVPVGHSSSVIRSTDPPSAGMTPLAVYQEWNIPAPTGAVHPDFLLSPTNERPPLVNREEEAKVAAAARSNEAKATNAQRPRRGPPPVVKRPSDPLFPPMPWKFQFRNSLQLGIFQEPGDTNGPNYGYPFQLATINVPHCGIWGTITWVPEISWGPFGIGLYLPVIFGVRDQFYLSTNFYNASDWDFNTAEDVLNKLVYLQMSIWRFTARYGGIPDLTWGGGHLLDGYNNMLEFPVKQVKGLVVSYKDRWLGIGGTFFTGDLSQKLLYGARLDWYPFQSFAPPERKDKLGAAGRFAMGFNWLLMDTPIKPTLTNSHPLAAYSNTNNSVDGYGLDMSLPLGKGAVRFNPFLSASMLDVRLGTNLWALGPGFAAGLKGELGLFRFRGEGYYNLNGFQARAFNPYNNYDWQRADEVSNLVANRATNSLGWGAELGINFGKAGSFTANFEAFYDTQTLVQQRNQVKVQLSLYKGAIKGFYANAFYIRQNVTLGGLVSNFIDANTLMGAEAHLAILGPMELMARYSLSFPNGASTPQGTLQVSLNFDFNKPSTNASALPAIPGASTVPGVPSLPVTPTLP